MNFEISTQSKFWIFEEEGLRNLKKEIYTKDELDEREGNLVSLYYMQMLYESFQEIKQNSWKVIESALMYLKRFMLLNSTTKCNMYLLVASVFLASKSEEMHFRSEELLKMFLSSKLEEINNSEELKKSFEISKELLEESEVILLSGIKFHLCIWHPYRSIRGLLLKYLIKFKKKIEVDMKKCNDIVGHLIIHSDIPFLLSPGQIALLVIWKVLKSKNVDIDGFVKEELESTSNEIKTIFYNGSSIIDNYFSHSISYFSLESMKEAVKPILQKLEIIRKRNERPEENH
jgi:hypothetical protein